MSKKSITIINLKCNRLTEIVRANKSDSELRKMCGLGKLFRDQFNMLYDTFCYY